MPKIIIWLVVITLSAVLLSSCITTKRTYQGAGVGGALGAVAGALIDGNNRWRGALLGGVIGAVMGGTVTELASRASREAAENGKPVAYESSDGWNRVEASPVDYDSNADCNEIREKTWKRGRLVKDETKRVCDG